MHAPPNRHSIARRIYHAMLIVSAIGMLAMVSIVSFIGEDLEDSMLAVEMQRERQFILANHDLQRSLFWNAEGRIVVYAPKEQSLPADLPALLRDIPAHYSAEVETPAGDTWLVSAAPTETGQLVLAKNITHFEDRETLFERVLLVVALAILGLSWLAAAWSSRRLIRPLQQLSHTIAQTSPGSTMPRIAEHQMRDAELHAIATTFNRFLDELEAYVQRERALLRMAGHELRTPIAVMSGALDVLQSRGQLGEQDRATLARARRACGEMRDNTNTLLALARREAGQTSRCATQPGACVDLRDLIQSLAADLDAIHPQRLVLDLRAPLCVQSDPAMARMLLHNLMHNALAHTRQTVYVTVTADAVEVADQGQGLSPRAQAVLRGAQALASDGAVLGGLGLYVVTLLGERLGWKLEIVHTGEGGTRIRVVPVVQGSSSDAAGDADVPGADVP